MLRRSRLTFFIVPNSSSPELPLFLSAKEKTTAPSIGDIYRRVMEYDHRQDTCGAQLSNNPPKRNSFVQRCFSGSIVGAVATAAGVLLFILTFAYHVGKPVVDAHREYFSKLALKDCADDESSEDCDILKPVEEFDDAVAEDEG